MFQDYEKYCEKKTNTHGETYFLGPEIDLWKTTVPTYGEVEPGSKKQPKQTGSREEFSVSTRQPGYSYSRVAGLQLAVREHKGKPAKNIHLDLIKDGNIQLPALHINANGRYVVDIEGDSIEFTYVDLIDALAAESLKTVKEKKERKRDRRKSAVGWLVTLSILGGAGYGGYKFFTREEEQKKSTRELFDENGYEIDGVALQKGGEDMVIVTEYVPENGLAFDNIPGYEDGEGLASPRRFNIEAGSCRDLGFLPDGYTAFVAKRPGTLSKITTIEDDSGQYYVCAPDYLTRASGESRVVVKHEIAIQYLPTTEQD